MSYVIGDRVRSVKVGRKDEFTGVVVSYGNGGANVREDGTKNLWLRNSDELTVIPKEEETNAVQTPDTP